MLRTHKHVAESAWCEMLRIHGLDSVAGVYRNSSGQVVTRSGSTEVRRLVLQAGNETKVIFIKKYWVNRWGQLWSGMMRGTFFGRSKARREYENLHRLREWGVDAPEPVAFGEERHARWLLRSYLISLGVPNPVPLDLFIRDRLPRKSAIDWDARRRELLDALAAATRRLHDHRFVHHDYFWRNIILSGEQMDHFWLIDAHKGRVWSRWGEEKARATDLAALDAPAMSFFRKSERLRFFLRYCGKRRLDPPARRLLKMTLRLAEPMRTKQGRRVGDAQGLLGIGTMPPV